MLDLFKGPKDEFRLAPAWHTAARELGLDAMAVFRDPRIKVWRDIPERQNCLLDEKLSDGTPIRWHIKRYRPQRGGGKTPADLEAMAIRAVELHNLPTLDLVGWGKLKSGFSFLITNDLAGYVAGDKFIEAGHSLDLVLEPTAHLAAQLHNANLFHQDLYLCHFFFKTDFDGQYTPPKPREISILGTAAPGDLMSPVTPAAQEEAPESSQPVRLIDLARLKANVSPILRRHYLVKDLAQYAYSLQAQANGSAAWDPWFDRYVQIRGLSKSAGLKRSIQRKIARIARHDQSLRQKQPHRNISIPQPPAAKP